MTLISSFESTSTVAWSPDSTLIAAASVSGALDKDFSASSTLQLLSFKNNSLSSTASIKTNARFNRIAWSNSFSTTAPFGLIAGALENNEFTIWNPKDILDGKKEAYFFKPIRQKGSIKGLDFNFDASVIATGASDAEILLYDISNPNAAPSHPGPKSSKLEDITAVQFNKVYPYILASSSINGNTVIWDMRHKSEVATLTHVGGRKQISCIAWNPDSPTQICTASDDDFSPVVLMWDLRNSRAPEKVLSSHTKGILALSWCQKDSTLLISSGKDNRTVVWNPVTANVIGDIHRSHNWTFDVTWSVRNPDLVCLAGFDGVVGVHSLQKKKTTDIGELGVQASVEFSLKTAPKWLVRPCGVSWGFGSRLVSFSATGKKSIVNISTVSSEEIFKARARELENCSLSNNFIDFCENRVASEFLTSEKDRDVWKFIHVMFQVGTREQLFQYFGISKDEIVGNMQLLKKLVDSVEASPKIQSPALVSREGPFKLFSEVHDEKNDTDALIMKAVLVGNFDVAVRICFGANRLSDALMFASCGGQELLSYAQEEYIKRTGHEKSYIRVLQAVLKGDVANIVENANIETDAYVWKDLLTLICTYARDEELSDLIGIIGKRLETSGLSSAGKSTDWKVREDKKFASTLCYLASGNLSKVLQIWSERESEEEKLFKTSKSLKAPISSPFAPKALALQNLIEKIQIFRGAIGFVDPELNGELENAFSLESLYQHYVDYADLVVSQGLVNLAWNILLLIPDSYKSKNSVSLGILKDRIYNSGLISVSGPKPRLPYEIEDILKPNVPQQNTAYNSHSGYGQNANNVTPYGVNQHNQYGSQGVGQVPENSYSNHSQAYNPRSYDAGPKSYGYNNYGATNSNPLSPTGSSPAFIPSVPSSGYSYPANTFAPPPISNTTSHASVYQQQPVYGTGYQSNYASNYNSQNQNSYGNSQSYSSSAAYQPPPPPAFQAPPPPAPGPALGLAQKSANVGFSLPQAPAPISDLYPNAYIPQADNNPPIENLSVTSPTNTNYPPVSGKNQLPPKPISAEKSLGDRSKIPASQLHIVTGMDELLAKSKAAASGNVNQKRECEDTEKKINLLVDQMNEGKLSGEIISKIESIVKKIQEGEYSAAHKLQVELMTTQFQATSSWILGIKRLIDGFANPIYERKQSVGGNSNSGQGVPTGYNYGVSNGSGVQPPNNYGVSNGSGVPAPNKYGAVNGVSPAAPHNYGNGVQASFNYGGGSAGNLPVPPPVKSYVGQSFPQQGSYGGNYQTSGQEPASGQGFPPPPPGPAVHRRF